MIWIVASDMQSARLGMEMVLRMRTDATVYIKPESSTMRPTTRSLSGLAENADTLDRVLHNFAMINAICSVDQDVTDDGATVYRSQVAKTLMATGKRRFASV